MHLELRHLRTIRAIHDKGGLGRAAEVLNITQSALSHQIRALEDQTITLYGDGRQVRDIMHVADAVQAYVSAWERIEQVSGRAFNLGGGPANAVSLRRLIAAMGEIIGWKAAVAGFDPMGKSFHTADFNFQGSRYAAGQIEAAGEGVKGADPSGRIGDVKTAMRAAGITVR